MRYPTPQERAFLVNFITLLATPVGSELPYDGITDMAGMLVDEAFKATAEDGNPIYSSQIEESVDSRLQKSVSCMTMKTTWWKLLMRVSWF